VLAIILAGYAMAVLDVSIVMVALPTIDHDLGFSATGLSWVHNAYALAFGGLLLVGARARSPAPPPVPASCSAACSPNGSRGVRASWSTSRSGSPRCWPRRGTSPRPSAARAASTRRAA
jgi:MFS family permease